ncbi:hypothetical protein P152DRAFT_477811 [Eremomyces bilateralis CBS 781.70]|uniref:DUF6570 domain-containing protein n=1 Tax=Eremomyces bilateralis CBS 781.70 TaxID=1392243 RepID=A0A6G1FQA1_9PEZI|nr:uncharacterized protein P152DRAFT_477811 [Eremomyces bilateralis CBS 781.70]KAF1807871.1 hypothetical protein P152DRAFT_477811 [Eremomyces bilateralis CBS 781.70]
MPRATSSGEVAGSTKHGSSEISPAVVANRSHLGRRRSGSAISRETPSKRVRRADRSEWSEEEQRRELDGVMRGLDNEFAEKEQLSYNQAWYTPIPTRSKVNTVQEFYKAFHDVNTLPILTYMFCYGNSCLKHLEKGSLSPAAQLHDRLGCEHIFPGKLKDLTPIEEKLIALNSCYGFIAQYSIPNGPRQGVRYRRHVKGHITVFPNNVQELVANVLPHPLLKVVDEIHVSWHIEIDVAELDSWDAPLHGVPSRVYERLRRDEPSAQEKARTGQVVPSTERGLDEGEAVDIREDPGNKRRGGTAEVRRWNGAEPYIVVNRGEDFADPFDARFFAKTFPTLFPLGRGGPLQADKSIQDVAGARDVGIEAADRLRGLIISRNMSLET